MLRTILHKFRAILRRFAPNYLLEIRRKRLRAAERQLNIGRSSREIFESIYAEGKWGGDSPDSGSGEGSQFSIAHNYIDYVNHFIAAQSDITRIVDIGCGDFRVARHFKLRRDQRYVGTDIVGMLVDSHERRFGSDQISFKQLDAATDPLPDADLFLVRQVLQHLSNSEVFRVLQKIQAAPYSLVTEHHPAPNRLTKPNLDKPTGPDVRVYDGSGVYLEHPPFNIRNTKRVLITPLEDGLRSGGETLVTYFVPGDRGGETA